MGKSKIKPLFRVQRTGQTSVDGQFTRGVIYDVVDYRGDDYVLLGNSSKRVTGDPDAFDRVEVSPGHAVAMRVKDRGGVRVGYRFAVDLGLFHTYQFDLSIEAAAALNLNFEYYRETIELRFDRRFGRYVSADEAYFMKIVDDLSSNLGKAAQILRIPMNA